MRHGIESTSLPARSMSGQNMESGSVSKRKESSVNEAVTSNGPRKRTKMTASRSKSKKSQHSESDGESAGENDGPDAFPVNPADFLSNLKNRCMRTPSSWLHEDDH